MKKNNRTLLESIKKDIFKGFKRFFWYFYTVTKYFMLTFLFNLTKKETNNSKISLLCPTRERSVKFERLLKSFNNTCNSNSNIEILVLLDEDDNQIDKYKKIITEETLKKNNIKLFIKNFKTHAQRNNFLASKSTGEILFPINDDMIFESKNWDFLINQEFSKIQKNKPYCLWIDSGKKYRYLHCDFPIINRNWYKTLGYVGSEFFNFWYLDTWICDLSFRSKKFLVSSKIRVSQISANTHENEVDNTHLKNIKDGIPEKDYQIWKDTLKNRIIESKKLI